MANCNCIPSYGPGFYENDWKDDEHYTIDKAFYELFERYRLRQCNCDDSMEDRVRPLYSKGSRKDLEVRANNYWEQSKRVTSMEKEEFIEKVLEEFDKRKPDEDKQYRGFIYYILDMIPKSVIDSWISLNEEIEE